MRYNFISTRNQRLIEEVVDYAYRYNACIGIIGSSGLSKSHSIKCINSIFKTALSLKISPSSNLTSLRKELINAESDYSSSNDDLEKMIEEITNVSIKKKKDPTFIIEDVENANPIIISELISLRRRTSKSSGLIFTVSEAFYKKCFLKISKRVNSNDLSELDVDKWVNLKAPTKNELIQICRVNGITKAPMINSLTYACSNFSELSHRIHRIWRSNKE